MRALCNFMPTVENLVNPIFSKVMLTFHRTKALSVYTTISITRRSQGHKATVVGSSGFVENFANVHQP